VEPPPADLVKSNYIKGEIKMQMKFHVGSVEVRIPSNEYTPEINVSLKDISYEVSNVKTKDLKVLTTYIQSCLQSLTGTTHEKSSNFSALSRL